MEDAPNERGLERRPGRFGVIDTASDMVLKASRADRRAPWHRKMPQSGPVMVGCLRQALKLQTMTRSRLADAEPRAEIQRTDREKDAVSDEHEDWEVSPRAQPRAADYGFDLDRTLSSVVGLSARVASDAYTADTLGIERGGNGVVIREDGVVLTIGYLVTEAEEVLLETHRGRVVPAHVLGYDQASGFGLVQALEPLDVPALTFGDSRHAGNGERVILAGAGGRRHSIAADIVARQEFAGYWEYLIEEAIFTAPGHPNWGGAALIGKAGDLLGIGSLQLQHQAESGRVRALNMVVPIELLLPIYDDLLAGKTAKAPRPWLGVYAHEIDKAVVIVGIADKGPADRAGLRKGDIVKVAAGMDIANLADFYRSMWALGAPGVEVPLTLEREGDVFDIRITSSDRRQFLKRPRLH